MGSNVDQGRRTPSLEWNEDTFPAFPGARCYPFFKIAARTSSPIWTAKSSGERPAAFFACGSAL